MEQHAGVGFQCRVCCVTFSRPVRHRDCVVGQSSDLSHFIVCDRQSGETGEHVAKKLEDFKAAIPGHTWDVRPPPYTPTPKKRKVGEGDQRQVVSKDAVVYDPVTQWKLPDVIVEKTN